MKHNYRFAGLVLCVVMFWGLKSELGAQNRVLEVEGVEKKSGLMDSQSIPRTTVFPVFRQTGNPDQDNQRFMEMVQNWNTHHPDQTLNAEAIQKIKAGTFSTQEEALMERESLRNPVKPRVRENLQRDLLTDNNLAHVYGYPELPQYPGDAAGFDAHKDWLERCKIWNETHPEVTEKIKSGKLLTEYPYKDNPESDPDYPRFVDTGNTEKDKSAFQQQQKAYAEKLKQYLPQE